MSVCRRVDAAMGTSLPARPMAARVRAWRGTGLAVGSAIKLERPPMPPAAIAIPLLCALTAFAPRPALSHPHVFVDTEVEVLINADSAAPVRCGSAGPTTISIRFTSLATWVWTPIGTAR